MKNIIPKEIIFPIIVILCVLHWDIDMVHSEISFLIHWCQSLFIHQMKSPRLKNPRRKRSFAIISWLHRTMNMNWAECHMIRHTRSRYRGMQQIRGRRDLQCWTLRQVSDATSESQVWWFNLYWPYYKYWLFCLVRIIVLILAVFSLFFNTMKRIHHFVCKDAKMWTLCVKL